MALLSDMNPVSVFVALDVGKSFRKKLSPQYKAKRKPMPHSLKEQVTRTLNQSSDQTGGEYV